MDEIRCSVEFQPDETRQGPGRLVGTILTYGERIVHTKGREQFEPGALEWGDGGVTFFDTHGAEPRTAIAVVQPEHRDNAVRVNFVLPDNGAARRVAQLFREGRYKGLSAEFSSVDETRDAQNTRRIKRAFLNGFAAVENQAYPSATVEVRDAAKKAGIWTWL